MNMARLREFDGSREINATRIGASVFCWREGGASFEFDAGTFMHSTWRFLEDNFAAELDQYLANRAAAASWSTARP